MRGGLCLDLSSYDVSWHVHFLHVLSAGNIFNVFIHSGNRKCLVGENRLGHHLVCCLCDSGVVSDSNSGVALRSLGLGDWEACPVFESVLCERSYPTCTHICIRLVLLWKICPFIVQFLEVSGKKLSVLRSKNSLTKPSSSSTSSFSYNVFGSGDSALYGVENSTYYLRNGANNLNLLLPLSLLAPFLFIARMCFRKFRDKASVLLIACSPQWVWLGAITLLPHKEERFMYVVYPQIMLAASATIVYIGSLLACVSKKHFRLLKVLAIAAAVICSSALSVSRVGALLWNYNANMRIYMGIHGMAPKADGDGSPPCVVCMGSEWYEYPSSFFVPQSCKVNFLKSEFGGVLPAHFNASLGGTRSAAAYLNDRNEADDRQYIEDESACTFLVALKYDDKLSEPKLQKKGWNVVKELHYVQSSASKALYRALYIPFLSRRNLKYNYYVLYNKA